MKTMEKVGENQISSSKVREAMLLLALPVLAWAIVVCNSNGLIHLLGWSKRPGWLILLLLTGLGVIAFAFLVRPFLIASRTV